MHLTWSDPRRPSGSFGQPCELVLVGAGFQVSRIRIKNPAADQLLTHRLHNDLIKYLLIDRVLGKSTRQGSSREDRYR